jgi:hypothetical protein
MTQRTTNRGQVVDLEKLMSQQGDRPAIGNMGTDGKGNRLGPGGTVVQSNEDRVRKYLKDNPAVSQEQVSLKGTMPNADVNAATVADVKTAKTAAENVRTSKLKPDAAAAKEPDEFSAPEGVEPLGYNEVTLPNGDIEMVPYYKKEDKKK